MIGDLSRSPRPKRRGRPPLSPAARIGLGWWKEGRPMRRCGLGERALYDVAKAILDLREALQALGAPRAAYPKARRPALIDALQELRRHIVRAEQRETLRILDRKWTETGRQAKRCKR